MYDSNWKIVVTIGRILKAVFAKFHSHSNIGASIISRVLPFVLTPMLILILYPCSLCQKYLRLVFPQRWQIVLQIFVDSFQGCLKDGMEQMNRDYRWFSVVPVLLQMMIFITYSVTFVSHFLFGGILTMMVVLAAILTILVEPYKPKFGHYSNHFAVFVIFSACVFTSIEIMGYRFLLTKVIYAAAGFIAIIHQVYIMVIVFYWFKKKK